MWAELSHKLSNGPAQVMASPRAASMITKREGMRRDGVVPLLVVFPVCIYTFEPHPVLIELSSVSLVFGLGPVRPSPISVTLLTAVHAEPNFLKSVTWLVCERVSLTAQV